MDEISDLERQFAQLARLALEGNKDDIELFVRRIAKKLGKSNPDFGKSLQKIISSPKRGNVLRGDVSVVPVDSDSRLDLVRCETPFALDQPIWPTPIKKALQLILEERSRVDELADADLLPTRSILFTGPPGVGKTLTAKWLASELELPILTLDLSAVMSSYLGKTGNNLRVVLDYAKNTKCILLLDEFDSIAKRRDDAVEVGELKRLVTVLLQEIESWPSQGLLIAATNHDELLDPAIWRRFDVTVSFPLPDEELLSLGFNRFLGNQSIPQKFVSAIIRTFENCSFSDLERELNRLKRQAIITGSNINDLILEYIQEHIEAMEWNDKLDLALYLRESGWTQRDIQSITKIARDTLRKHIQRKYKDSA